MDSGADNLGDAVVDVAPPRHDLTYISLGAGVQSSALLVCSLLGLHRVPRADVAIFADTQNEPPHVYRRVGCGFTIHASETYCGECLCEEDSE